MTRLKLINKQDLFNPAEFHQVLKADGTIAKGQKADALNATQIVEAYKWMVQQRRLDEKLLQMQRQGRMLTFAPNMGEEALQIAVGMAMNKGKDWLVQSFRSGLIAQWLGVPMKNYILYWNGQERGSQNPASLHVLPVNIVIGTQCSHAAGIGYALKLKKENAAALSFIGDGGTAEGEFYEAMNIASIHKWNTVFCVNNNQWAISTPTSEENGAVTIAVKGVAAGIPGIRVDGNDVFASFEAISEALEWTRNGNGPILVEFLTYRQGPHTTSDNPRLYRTEAYEKEQLKKEPIARLRNYLMKVKLWDEKKEAKLLEEIDAAIMEAYNASQKELKSTLDEVFDYTYSELTQELKEQKAEAKALVAKGLLSGEY